MIDDVGFGQLSPFGGLLDMPVLDRLSDDGPRYANMQTTALCSPTRGCILTGRNHHSLGLSAITELSVGFPAHNGMMGFEHGFLSEMLLEQGYNTFAVGKWHLTPPEEGYHLNIDLADRAIQFLKDANNTAPDKPFFVLPLATADMERMNAERPTLLRPRQRFVYEAGGSALPFGASPRVYNRPHSITAEVVVPEPDEESDAIGLATVMDGKALKSRSLAFRVGSALTLAGASLIDLREAALEPAGA